MKLSPKHAKYVSQAIHEWQETHLISDKVAHQLNSSIEVTPFDWKRLARLAFLVSIFCFVIAISSILMNKYIMELIALYFSTPALAKAGIFVLLSLVLYGWGAYRKRTHPDTSFRNESIFFMGVLTTAATIFYLGSSFQILEKNFTWLLLYAALAYGAIGFAVRSPLIWAFSLLSLGSWMGAETGYMSGWGAYYFGMSYPLRFILFGGLLVTAAFTLKEHPRGLPFFQTTLVIGLLYLFMSLWILSIFGNHSDLNTWVQTKQIELFHWSFLFALVAGGAIYHGLKFDNTTTRGFGIVFLLINIYTRFFEFFWDSLHKAIFFALLGISLWFLGVYAERIWNFRLADPSKS